MSNVVYHDFCCYGGQRELWTCRDPEVLVEGPAGTGKTRNVLEYIDDTLTVWPNVRVLFCRQTRKSMTESVLWTWEEEVLTPTHPALTSSQASRRMRDEYRYPNGSTVVVLGLDNPGKTYSSQYDIVVVFEAWETSLDAWERLGRCMRNTALPWRQRIADTNPAGEYHWLNQRALEGEMTRIRTLHRDNPVYYNHDLDIWTPMGQEYVEGVLAKLTGARHANLYEGRWANAEGIILEEYDPGTHVIEKDSERYEEVLERGFDWYFGSMDVGMRHPGCLLVWGVKRDVMYCVAEVYRTGWVQDEWVEVVMEINDSYPLEALVVDPAEPQWIETMNRRFGPARGRDGDRIARKGKNDIKTGVDMMRWHLADGRVFFMSDRLRYGRDPARQGQRKPCSLTEEVSSWTWPLAEDGKPVKEKPDPLCSDHAMDAWRYGAMYKNLDRDQTPPKVDHKFPRHSLGDVLGHGEVRDQIRRMQ